VQKGKGMSSVQTRDGSAGAIAEINLPNLALNFVKVHWLASSLWVLGILIMTVAPAPVSVTPEMESEFNDLMEKALKTYGPTIEGLQQKVYASQHKTNEAYGWFLNEDENRRYTRLLNRQQDLEAELGGVQRERNEMENEARSKVGLWSEYGLVAVRDKFWYMVSEGSGFAKRSTMWDAVFMMFSGRSDEGIASIAAKLLMRFIFNFTIGMIGALIGFFWALVGVIQSFNPDTAEAVLFYGVAGLGGLSMVALFCISLYGTAGGAIYYAAKAARTAQLEGGGQRRQYIQRGQASQGYPPQGFRQPQPGYQQRYGHHD
jgi:hypothetical protein